MAPYKYAAAVGGVWPEAESRNEGRTPEVAVTNVGFRPEVAATSPEAEGRLTWPEATSLGPPDVRRGGCGPPRLEAAADVVAPPEPEAVDCARLRKTFAGAGSGSEGSEPSISSFSSE